MLHFKEKERKEEYIKYTEIRICILRTIISKELFVALMEELIFIYEYEHKTFISVLHK